MDPALRRPLHLAPRRILAAALAAWLCQPGETLAQVDSEPPPDPLSEFELYEGEAPVDDHTFLRKVAPVAPALSARRLRYQGVEWAEATAPAGQIIAIIGAGLLGGGFVASSLGRSSLWPADVGAQLLALGAGLQTTGLVTTGVGATAWVGALGAQGALAPRVRPFYLLEAERAAAKYNVLNRGLPPLRVRRLEALRSLTEPGAQAGAGRAAAVPTSYLSTETAQVLSDGVWLASVGAPTGSLPLLLAVGVGGQAEADLALGLQGSSSGHVMGHAGAAWKHRLVTTSGSQLALRAALGVTGLGDMAPAAAGATLSMPVSFSLGPVTLTTTPQARLADLSAARLGLEVGGSVGAAWRVGGGWSLLGDVAPRVGLAGGFDAPAGLGLRYQASDQACLDLTVGHLGLRPEVQGRAGLLAVVGHVRL
ncbi:MAG: hypothetical protein VKS61_17040 [Candidatus Sericytochromatia bacterium]|nr:hypothetical protein [Candidatus Sericytochromatia bacterium]